MDGVDHYATLELKLGCPFADIKRAYKRLALVYHPDKNSDSDAGNVMWKMSDCANIYIF